MIVTNAFYELVLELMPYQTMTNAYFLAVNTTVDPIKFVLLESATKRWIP